MWTLLAENWLEIAVALHGVAVVIVGMTATPEDNKWVGKAYKVIEMLAGVFGRAKELPGEAKMREEQV